MLPVDFLLMIYSIRDRILLIVCDIFLRKEAENRHFGRYSDAKTAVYPLNVIRSILVSIESACTHSYISDQ